MNATNTYILSLGEISAVDVKRAGAKAANLGELARAGFPVPPGIVLTTEAFRRFVAANGLGADSPAEAVNAAHFPPDLARAFSAAAQPLNGTPMAVRSSAVAEDLAGASFA